MPIDNRKPGDILREYQTGTIQTPQVKINLPEGTPSYANAFLRPRPDNNVVSEDYTEQALAEGYGKSKYDSGYYPGMDLEQQRAVEQSGASKILNGALKGGVTAGTTAVNTVAGTLWGAVVGAANLIENLANNEDQPLMKAIDAGVNNGLSEYLLNIQKLSEEWFPNYRTEEERSDKYQKQWIRHVFTPNFIGDSFLKNLGFTVGAMAGGMVWSGALGAALRPALANDLLKGVAAAAGGDAAAQGALKGVVTKFARGQATKAELEFLKKNIRGAAKQINRLGATQMLAGATIGAMGEGVTEGIMARNEFMDKAERDWQESIRKGNEDAENDVYNSGNLKWVKPIKYVMPDGTAGSYLQLTEEGQKEIDRRKADNIAKHQEAHSIMEEEGDRLAASTFLLNIPVLTLSNTIQFGRMFSGGWKTTRKTLAKVSGDITEDAAGKIVGKFSPRASKAILGTTNALKVGLSENAEEMVQGYISSGAKNVADARLTSFYDDGYNPEVAKDFGEWVSTMNEGGMEYLTDWTNWQEGFMGFITGLLGMPSYSRSQGFKWNGGAYEAFKDAGEASSRSADLAAELNKKVNDPEWQKRWRGYARHNLYEKQMQEAVKANDEYAWHTANDKQMINDIMMFADAGRLDDLYDLVDRFSNMSDDQAEAAGIFEAIKSDKTEQDIDNNPEAAIATVKKHATELKDMIKEYREVYDDLLTIAPIGTSPEHLKELVFSAMQTNRFEQRYMNVLEEFLNTVYVKLEEDTTGTNKERAEKLRSRLARFSRLYSQITLPENDSATEIQADVNALTWLHEKAGKDKKLNSQLEDLEKLYKSRREFFHKFNELQKITSAEFNEQAQTVDKAAQEVRKEKIQEAASGIQSVQDINNAYRAIPVNNETARQEFMKQMSSIKDTNPYAKTFLEINSVRNDFNSKYSRLADRPDPASLTGIAVQSIVSSIFDSADSVEDLYYNYDSLLPSSSAVDAQLKAAARDAADAQRRSEAIDDAVAIVRGVLSDLAKADKEHRQVDDGKGDPFGGMFQRGQQTGQQGPEGSPFSGMMGGQAQAASPAGNPFGGLLGGLGSQAKKAKHKDAVGRTWSVGDTVYMYQLDEELNVIPFNGKKCTIDSITDTNEGEVAKLSEEGKKSKIIVMLNDSQVVRMQPKNIDKKAPAPEAPPQPVNIGKTDSSTPGTEMTASAEQEEYPSEAAEGVDEYGEEHNKYTLNYYHMTVPEINSFSAKDARKYARDKNLNAREKHKKLLELDLRNFNETEDGKQYNDVWNNLASWHGQNAFDNVAQKLKVGDKVKFVIDPNFAPNPDTNELPILVMLDRGGENDLLLTTLHEDREGRKTIYSGIPELQAKIREEYAAWSPKSDGELFVFSDKDGNPYTSTVYLKRKGIVIYDETERALVNGHGFDKNAPIVFVGRDGNLNLLHGTTDYNAKPTADLVQKLFGSPVRTDNPIGNLYYIAKGDTGYAIPIRLGVEHYNENTKQYTTKTFEKINKALDNIVKTVEGKELASDADYDKLNKALSEKVQLLGRTLDVHDVIFKVMQSKSTGNPELAMYRIVDGQIVGNKHVSLSEITSDWLRDAVASMDRSLNITSNPSGFDSLIDEGLITVNTDTLRPKQVDFCFYSWDAEKEVFLPQGKQEEILTNLTQKPAATAAEEAKVEKPKPEKAAAEKPSKKKDKKEVDIASPKKIAEQEQSKTVDTTWKQEWRNFDAIPEDIRKDLVGWTKEMWEDDEISDDDRKQALGCS